MTEDDRLSVEDFKDIVNREFDEFCETVEVPQDSKEDVRRVFLAGAYVVARAIRLGTHPRLYPAHANANVVRCMAMSTYSLIWPTEDPEAFLESEIAPIIELVLKQRMEEASPQPNVVK